MADDTRDSQPERVDAALGGMKIEEEDVHAEDTITVNATYEEAPTPEDATRSMSSTPAVEKRSSQSPDNMESASQSPKTEDEAQDVVGSDITVTVEPGKAPRLSRKSSKKVASRPAPLFNAWPDATAEAVSIFQVIKECIYAHKNMGYSEHDSLDCDCSEEWRDGSNHACGEDSDCINRATKMECVDGDCNCGSACQNQRFQRKQYADVSVIKTEKKGFGLRADRDLSPGDFIFEYIGEVIGDAMFRRRTIQYNEEGIKHFYFMSISKDVFVDATKKGNLGRFCNHSCNPNCYVDKWIVGEKLRMGIFAERHIQAGEELVFNYNVDRYGADPQPCYCGEPNCSGFLGGKTQTERATKLAHAVVEALGIDDGDGWDTAVAKKPRKKKTGEDDEEYVNNVQPKGLDVDGVRKVMAALMQCKEKWIAVKLLARLQRCDDDKVRNRVVQMHGYQILRTTLTTWRDDNNVVLQILDIIYKFPRLTRNKISDSKIENAIETLVSSEHEDVAFESKRLLEDWSKLEVAYRIPRKKFDPSTVSVFERRNTDRVEDVKSPAPAAVVAPTGPRSNMPARNMSFTPSRPPVRRPYHTLPSGWFAAVDEKGNQYYYSKAGATTWHRPTLPAVEPPPPPRIAKSVQSAKALQDIIDSITRPDPSSATPTRTQSSVSTPKEKEKSVEKWRSLPREKQMKIYENTLFPHIKHVMSKFKDKLPKEDLKKFAKEVSKTLVASDYKNNRVTDPTKITAKQEKTVKSYVRGFFEKVVSKKKEHDRKKAEKQKSKLANAPKPTNGSARPEELKAAEDDDAEGLEETNLDSSPLEPDSPPQSPSSPDLKRKRDDAPDTPSQDFESKRLKDDENGSFSASPPPPPPPPPTDSPVPVGDVEMNDAGILATEEEIEMRMQEEALMRENEEAERMDLDGALTMESNSILNNGTGAGEDDTAANGNGNTNGVGSGVETRPAQA